MKTVLECNGGRVGDVHFQIRRWRIGFYIPRPTLVRMRMGVEMVHFTDLVDLVHIDSSQKPTSLSFLTHPGIETGAPFPPSRPRKFLSPRFTFFDTFFRYRYAICAAGTERNRRYVFPGDRRRWWR